MNVKQYIYILFYIMPITREDLRKYYIENEKAKQPELLKKLVENIRDEVLRANYAGKTMYVTPVLVYQDEFVIQLVDILKMMFSDSEVVAMRAPDQYGIVIAINWILDNEDSL
jgi:hypothetical protein